MERRTKKIIKKLPEVYRIEQLSLKVSSISIKGSPYTHAWHVSCGIRFKEPEKGWTSETIKCSKSYAHQDSDGDNTQAYIVASELRQYYQERGVQVFPELAHEKRAIGELEESVGIKR